MELLLCTLTGERHQGEKMERRLGKMARVRRRLFGPVDHERLRWDFQHMLRNNAEGAQQKWNFDFLRETPVEGLLQWEELKNHEVPTFYHSCAVGDPRRPLQHLNWCLGREDKSHRFAQVTLTEKPQTSKQTGRKRILDGKKRIQTSVTDNHPAKEQVKANLQAAAKKSTCKKPGEGCPAPERLETSAKLPQLSKSRCASCGHFGASDGDVFLTAAVKTENTFIGMGSLESLC